MLAELKDTKRRRNVLIHSVFLFKLGGCLRDILPLILSYYALFEPVNVIDIDTRFYALFYVKKEVSAKTLLFFLFCCGTVSRENWRKNYGFFVDFIGIKNEIDCGILS